jgi:hypothetical protein
VKAESFLMADLLEHLEVPQCTCLNAHADHTLRHAIEVDSRDDITRFLESDADEELLIHLQFMQAVKISHVNIEAVDATSAPSGIRLFVNKVGLDFDSARSDKPTQEFTYTESDVTTGSKPTELRYVLFQKVQTLGIFVPGNLGDEEVTRIAKLTLVGEPIQHAGIKRTADEQAASTKGDWLGMGIA